MVGSGPCAVGPASVGTPGGAGAGAGTGADPALGHGAVADRDAGDDSSADGIPVAAGAAEEGGHGEEHEALGSAGHSAGGHDAGAAAVAGVDTWAVSPGGAVIDGEPLAPSAPAPHGDGWKWGYARPAATPREIAVEGHGHGAPDTATALATAMEWARPYCTAWPDSPFVEADERLQDLVARWGKSAADLSRGRELEPVRVEESPGRIQSARLR